MMIICESCENYQYIMRKLSVLGRLERSGNDSTFATVMKEIKIETKRGTLLDGALFNAGEKVDTVLIAITGIHGNFYSNPFYYNIGNTLTAAGIDFIYAQTNDAFGVIRTMNTHTGKEEVIGSWNERFALTEEDVEAYIDYAVQRGYKHIILAGHSLGANKVIFYLSHHHDPRVEHFLLMSPANLDYMTASVSQQERNIIHQLYEQGHGAEILPFLLMGWVECTIATAYDWTWSDILNNVHTQPDGDFSQVSKITHTGALLIGTYDNFTDGDPSGFLRNISSHMPTTNQNHLIFIERTGHTYQQKHQKLADKILALIQDWQKK